MIHVIVGTKAQLIKMAPVMCRMKEQGIEYRYISTGQHNDTMGDILRNFDLSGPDFFLYKGKDVVSLFGIFLWSVRVLAYSLFCKRKVFGEKSTPRDVVLVHGDTISTLIGAIIGRLAGMRVAHVESGLRSHDFLNPFPEELTRVAVFRLSNIFFCQDERAVVNLEGRKGIKINTNGNTLYDALKSVPDVEVADVAGLMEKAFGIVTLHRYENLKNKLAVDRIMGLVEVAAEKYPLVFVLHKTTEKALLKYGFMERIEKNKKITIVPRMDYFSFVAMLRKAKFVISDGGSNQEECSYLGKPIVLLRIATERMEGVGENCLLSGYEEAKLVKFLSSLSSYEVPVENIKKSPSATIVDTLNHIS